MFFHDIVFLSHLRDVATQLLVAVAMAGCFVAFLALWRERRLFARQWAMFRSLTPLGRVAVVALLCLFTRWAGSKPDGTPTKGGSELPTSSLPSRGNLPQLRLGNEGRASTNGFSITAFEIDSGAHRVSFATAWPSNFLCDTVSRNVCLLASTNLFERRWTPLCTVQLPSETNRLAVSISENDVAAEVRQAFSDAFNGSGFFTFATDSDGDGDGLGDVEEFELGLDPHDPSDAMRDLDGDGIPTLYEVRNDTNPMVSDWELAPKTIIGTNGVSSLKQALRESGNYAIIVLPPGIHTGPEWTGLSLPPHPVMVTSGDCGRDRRAILRHKSSQMLAAFFIDDARSALSVFQGFTLDMSEARCGFNAGFWCGGNLPFSGDAVSAIFHNVYVRLPPTDAINVGFFCRHASSCRLGFAGCVVNANGAGSARGICCIDGPPALIENCSFLNFPVSAASIGYGIQLESTPLNWGRASDPVPVEISNCLFDMSFTNALPLAILDPGVKYAVNLHHGLMPRPSTNIVTGVSMLYTNAMAGITGLLAADSPARRGGTAPTLALFDPCGEARGIAPDVAAYQYTSVVDGAADTDGDGLSDYDELVVYRTDPLLWDTDGDGQDDYTEIFANQTDPLSRDSFFARITVSIQYVHERLPEVTNYLCYGYSPSGWEGCGQCCTDTNAVFRYEFPAQGEQVYVKLFADLDGNGVYDEGNDLLKLERVQFQGESGNVAFTVGDLDGDGQGDLFEREHGCDPLSASSFFVEANVAVTYKFGWGPGITNYLCHGYSPAGWEGLGQCRTDTNAVFHYAFPSQSEHVYMKLFTDVNANGVYDSLVDFLRCVEVKIGDEADSITFDAGDADGDGQGDLYETENGSDPFDRKSLYVRVHVEVTNKDAAYGFVTNCLAYGFSGKGWETNGGRRFTGLVYEADYDFVTTNGQAFVNVLYDFNGNGLHDEGVDALYRRQVTVRSNEWCKVKMAVGDADGDGVLDSEEDADGTDKFDGGNYRREITVRVTDAFKGVNPLSMALATNCTGVVVPVSGLVTVTSRQTSVGFPCLTLTNAPKQYVVFFDDLDGDGVREVGETMSFREVPATARHVDIELALPREPFDLDDDGMLDWREVEMGLDPHDAADAFADSDGDGLVNLHECWAGCAPFVPDGSNTLLSVMARSVDDRLAGKDASLALPIYSNYLAVASADDLGLNTNCWAYGIDFSCCSMWNSTQTPHKRAVTAISPRHVVMAEHYITPLNTIFSFRGTNGLFYSSRLVRKVRILNTDIAIGLLDTPLPSSVVPARILPIDFERYIGTGKGLPVITLDQEEKALVMELCDLPVGRHPDDLDKANVKCQIAHTAERQVFFEEVIDGDSSNPRFFVVGNELVLLCTMYKGWYGYGPLLTLYAGEIQVAMDSLCTDEHYALQEFDFSSYDQLPLNLGEL